MRGASLILCSRPGQPEKRDLVQRFAARQCGANARLRTFELMYGYVIVLVSCTVTPCSASVAGRKSGIWHGAKEVELHHLENEWDTYKVDMPSPVKSP